MILEAMRRHIPAPIRPALLVPALLALGACGSTELQPPDVPDRSDAVKSNIEGKLFGEDTFIFGGPSRPEDEGGAGIGVNSFLWRASLDTVSFMPLSSADPFGGVILTDWYAPKDTPDDRFKVNIFILSRQLRADGIRAAVFRQTRDPKSGTWGDAPVDPKTATELENAILTRARELRINTPS